MANFRWSTSVNDNEPVYSARRPKLNIPRRTCDISVTELHQAAEAGDVLVLAEQLMRSDVHVDTADIYGRTPLFYAVENDHVRTADWLMFNGADPYKYDLSRRSPMSESRSFQMTSVLCQRRSVQSIEFAILMDSAEYGINRIGIVIRTGNTFSPSPTYFMCRMIFPLESGAKSFMTKDEICWREIVEYRTSDTNDNSVVHLKVLFRDKPSRFQELVIKHIGSKHDITELKPEIYIKRNEDDEQFAAVVSVKLKHRGLLILCCRPRTEELFILPSGGKIVSKTDSNIQLDVPREAFRQPGKLTLKVDEVSKVPESDHILSLSHFFNMTHSSCSEPTKDVIVTLPTPDGFKGQGDVVIMSRSGSPCRLDQEMFDDGRCDDDDDDDDNDDDGGEQRKEKSKWKMMDVRPEVRGNKVSFKTSKLGLTTPVEVEKWATKVDITSDTARRYAQRSRRVICFMAVGKCIKYNTFDVVIECLHPDQCSRRLDEWATEDYKKLRISGDFRVRQTSKFRFQLHGNLSSLYTLTDFSLEMFPGQASHQSIILKVKDTNQDPTGSIAILKQQTVGLRLITHLPIFLHEQLLSRVAEEENFADVNEISKYLDVSQISDDNDNPPAAMASAVDDALSFGVADDNSIDALIKSATSDINEDIRGMPSLACTVRQNQREEDDDNNNRKCSADLHVSDDEFRDTVLSTQIMPISRGEVSCNGNSDSFNSSEVLPSSTMFVPIQHDISEIVVHNFASDAAFKREIIHWLSQLIIDVWWKVGIYLGFSNQLLTEYDHRQLIGPLAKSKLLLTEFFHQNQHQEDLGLRKLVDALKKVHKSDGINTVIEHLQAYQHALKRKDDTDNTSRFSRWVLSQEISKATLFQQFDTPGPGSDEFLVNLVMKLQPNFLLGIRLGLTYAEIEHIRQDASCIGSEYKMFTMLVKCRQKHGNNVRFLNNLLQTLKELELNETREWIIEYTKKWSPTVSESRSGFARQVSDIVRRYEEETEN